MYYWIFGLLGLAALGLDQWVKAWTTAHLALGETTPLLPGLVELMRVHNYGAAWSSFSGQKWLLLGVTGVIVLAVAWLLVRKVVRHPVGILACCLILSAIFSTGCGWAMWWICCISSSGPAIPRSTWRICVSFPAPF